jgi:hypothetical protein
VEINPRLFGGSCKKSQPKIICQKNHPFWGRGELAVLLQPPEQLQHLFNAMLAPLAATLPIRLYGMVKIY